MPRHKQQAQEQEQEPGTAVAPPLTEPSAEEGRENGEQAERGEISYTDKKGANWKRLMAIRFRKAQTALERLITLGTWTNYHYTQEEAKKVCDKLRATIKRIETAHQRDAQPEVSPLALPWED